MVSRRAVVGGAASGAAAGVGAGVVAWWAARQLGTPRAAVGFELSEDELARAVAFLDAHPAIDTHAHPGRTFVRGAEHLTWKLRLYARADRSRSGRSLTCSGATWPLPASRRCRTSRPSTPAVAGSPGCATSTRVRHGPTTARSWRTSEHWSSSGDVALVRTPDDVAAARAAGQVGAILGVEGADFLQDDLGRVEHCFADGVRVLTLVHYFRGGVIGDVMTAPPVHGGLTPFGRDVVQEMNRVGLVVDVSHCSERTAYDALEASAKPLLITHTDVAEGGSDNPRFVSEGLARSVAGAGGAVGAWPAGIRLDTLEDYVERIVDLVELLGEDHVCIGTDMDANYKPVFETYAKMPLVVGGLLRRGMSEAALAKVVGGNFLRVFADVLTP